MNGNLNINQTQSGSLEVFSTEEIAMKLGVQEIEIIKLIQNQKLLGKKIGNKYFVRKVDFDKFMKQ
jgi:excisionase family DNA binding protein